MTRWTLSKIQGKIVVANSNESIMTDSAQNSRRNSLDNIDVPDLDMRGISESICNNSTSEMQMYKIKSHESSDGNNSSNNGRLEHHIQIIASKYRDRESVVSNTGNNINISDNNNDVINGKIGNNGRGDGTKVVIASKHVIHTSQDSTSIAEISFIESLASHAGNDYDQHEHEAISSPSMAPIAE